MSGTADSGNQSISSKAQQSGKKDKIFPDRSHEGRCYGQYGFSGAKPCGQRMAGAGRYLSKPGFDRSRAKIRRLTFDFYIEGDGKKAFVEVKGVTLEEEGIARFPDAPTERGVKHVKELMKCIEEGYEAYIIFVIQMKGTWRFEPNDKRHPEFGTALREAGQAGVHIQALDCRVGIDSLVIDQPVPVVLD